MYNFIIQSKALRYQHCIVGGGTPGTHLDIIVDNERSNEERRLKNTVLPEPECQYID